MLALYFTVVGLSPGPNPMIVSYNASAVKIFNATSGLVRIETKNAFLYNGKTLRPTTALAL
jgi:hypothetical protein